MPKPIPIRRRSPNEDGYILIWVIFLMAAFTLWLSVAVPRAAKEIQRDREVETMHRGKQYIRAIQLYYRKFHAFPPNADALVKTTEIRFLRKKYIDPMTGKSDWKPIRFGQAKTQTLGFFGQPLAGTGSAGGSVVAGTGPSGGSGISGSSISGSSSSAFGGSSLFSSTGSSASGSSGSTGGTSSSGSSSSDTGLTGQTFGGAGIVGFSPASSRQSILIYKKKNHYNEWEFVYDPLSDMKTVSGNTGTIGQPASSTTSQPGTTNSGTSTGSSSGTGSSSDSGSSSSSPTQQTSPQQ